MPIYLMGPHSARPTMGSWVEDLGCRNTAPRHPVHILKVPGELRREAREEGLGPPKVGWKCLHRHREQGLAPFAPSFLSDTPSFVTSGSCLSHPPLGSMGTRVPWPDGHGQAPRVLAHVYPCVCLCLLPCVS